MIGQPRRHGAMTLVAGLGVVGVVGLLGGCLAAGGGGDGASRPAVMPLLSELPVDPIKRDAILDQANTMPGPEHRKPLPPRQQRAATTAATAAAILGSMFSKTKNVTLGTASSFDETGLAGRPRAARSTAPDPDAPDGLTLISTDPDAPAPAPAPDPTPVTVPWVKLQ